MFKVDIFNLKRGEKVDFIKIKSYRLAVASFVMSVMLLFGVGINAFAAETGRVSVMGDSISTHSDYDSFCPTYTESYDANYMYYNLYINATNGVRGKIDAISMTTISPRTNNGSNEIMSYVLSNPMDSQERIDTLDDNGTPDTILVLGGINDMFSGISIEDFTSAYDDFLNRLKATYPNADIICITPFVSSIWGNNFSYNAVTPYVNAIKECANGRASVIDLSNVDIMSDTMDGTHPNREGHIKIFNKLMEDMITPPSSNYSGLLHTDYGTWMYSNGQIDMSYTGIIEDGGRFCYVNRGYLDTNYTGMALNAFGWWYFENGSLNWDYTGEATNGFGTWFFENGRINWDANGMIWTGSKWRMASGGRIDTGYTGMANNWFGWWYFTDGELDLNYTGMANNIFGWWYYTNGRLDWTYTGEANNLFGTWFYENGHINWDANGMIWTGSKWRMANGGHIDTGYTGMTNNIFGWWYFTNGDIDWTYTGMAANIFGWWYYTNGKLDWTYTGIGENVFGKWLYINGRIPFDYYGQYTIGGVMYNVQGGHIV